VLVWRQRRFPDGSLAYMGRRKTLSCWSARNQAEATLGAWVVKERNGRSVRPRRRVRP
jgi:hypothetical protein